MLTINGISWHIVYLLILIFWNHWRNRRKTVSLKLHPTLIEKKALQVCFQRTCPIRRYPLGQPQTKPPGPLVGVQPKAQGLPRQAELT